MIIEWYKRVRNDRLRKRQYEDEIFGALNKRIDSSLKGWWRTSEGYYKHEKDNIEVRTNRSPHIPALCKPQHIHMPRRWKKILNPKFDLIEFIWQNNNKRHIVKVINGEYPFYIHKNILRNEEKKVWFNENVKGRFVEVDTEKGEPIYFLDEETAMAWKLTFEG